MKRILIALWLTGASAVSALAAEGAAHGEAEDKLFYWKLANFAVLALILGYFIYKKAGGFYQSRTDSIRKDLDEAARMNRDAEAKYAEMEQKLASLGAEIEKLKAQARQESEAEAARLKEETARDLAKVQTLAEHEIASAAKTARQELRAYSAELAIGLAERKIREHLTPEIESGLVSATLKSLEKRSEQPPTRVS